ncbi:MAG: polyhydroxyalkanoate synthesis regulator DNA-binding domain-containing protein [Isosphaeraceae bacterium]
MPNPTPEVVSIKRYPNRRLYDRQSRRYITLQDLEALVLEGKKIEVRDSKTGEDLTRAILTQILLERHPEKMEMFPVAMLHGILQANDMVLEFFRSYLRQSLAILEQMQQPTPLATFLTPIDWMRAIMPSAIPFTTPFTPPAASGGREDLNLRISAIEERIRRLEQSSAPAGSTAKVGSALPSALALSTAKESATLDRLEKRLSQLESEGEEEIEEENE